MRHRGVQRLDIPLFDFQQPFKIQNLETRLLQPPMKHTLDFPSMSAEEGVERR